MTPPRAVDHRHGADPLASGQVAGAASWLCDQVYAHLGSCGLVVHVAAVRGRRGPTMRHVAALCRAEAMVLGAPSRRRYRAARSLPAWMIGRASYPVIIVP